MKREIKTSNIVLNQVDQFYNGLTGFEVGGLF